ncbi:hypothetical protein CLU79DRAFT_733202, partial [Phycomyces nitens]
MNEDWVDYNTSHEGDWVVFVATNRPGLAVGIDCVWLDMPNTDIPQFLRSFQSQLSAEEMEWVFGTNEHKKMLKRFYELWACKESHVKAIGLGLQQDLDTLSFKNKTEKEVGCDLATIRKLIL